MIKCTPGVNFIRFSACRIWCTDSKLVTGGLLLQSSQCTLVVSRQFLQYATPGMGYRKRWKITLQALHIPGVLNVIADRLSRKGQMHQSEWSLDPSVFKLICKKLYTPMVDAFATADNNKLQLYFSPIPDHMPTLWMLSARIGHSFPSMRFPLLSLSKKSSASSLISLLLFAGGPFLAYPDLVLGSHSTIGR